MPWFDYNIGWCVFKVILLYLLAVGLEAPVCAVISLYVAASIKCSRRISCISWVFSCLASLSIPIPQGSPHFPIFIISDEIAVFKNLSTKCKDNKQILSIVLLLCNNFRRKCRTNIYIWGYCSKYIMLAYRNRLR